MAVGKKISRGRASLGQFALKAARSGDFASAHELYEKTIKAEPRNATHRHNFAIILQRLERFERAAVELTQALRLNPRMVEAAERLAMLAERSPINTFGALEPSGLKAALLFDNVAHQPLSAMAIGHLEHATEWGKVDDPRPNAAQMVTKKTAKILRNPLLLLALRRGINTSAKSEILLSALRRAILLDVAKERFRDNSLTEFVLALAEQLSNNEHIHFADEEEKEALQHKAINLDALLEGNVDEGVKLLQQLLYQRAPDVLRAELANDDLVRIRPRTLKDFVVREYRADQELTEAAQSLKSFGAITDPTSESVRYQYERRPYPRWRSLQTPRPGAIKSALEKYFRGNELAFLEKPFNVLIAGAGTGQQVCRSAIGYGDNARIIAIDLSQTSLAYAQRMARRYAITNVDFRRGDLLDIADLNQGYDIIECSGVLHHMADPFEGWRRLVEALKPGGLMLVALYSRISRENIIALRHESDYPGPNCSDDEARSYRQRLLDQPSPPEGEADLRRSIDFYSLSGFRDLVLHESEMQFTLTDISAFLNQLNLEFRGFAGGPQLQALFDAAYPDDVWPGRLSNWQKFEKKNPRAFDLMYNFWCRKMS